MKKCIFIGTCQVVALAEILNKIDGFSREYGTEAIIPVHAYPVEKMDNIIENIKSIDLIIAQPISQQYLGGKFSTKRLLENIDKEKTRIIMLPFAYFDGYYPSIFYMKDSLGNKVEKNGISYHDRNILKHLMEAIDINKTELDDHLINTHNESFHIERITKLLNSENYYGKETSERAAFESVKKLEFREFFPYDYGKSVDVKISDYIRDNFRNKCLFHTMNHPTNDLLYELARRILKILNMDTDFNLDIKELLGGSEFGIYPSTINKLGLKFAPSISIEDFVKKYVTLYFREIKVSTLLINYL